MCIPRQYVCIQYAHRSVPEDCQKLAKRATSTTDGTDGVCWADSRQSGHASSRFPRGRCARQRSYLRPVSTTLERKHSGPTDVILRTHTLRVRTPPRMTAFARSTHKDGGNTRQVAKWRTLRTWPSPRRVSAFPTLTAGTDLACVVDNSTVWHMCTQITRFWILFCHFDCSETTTHSSLEQHRSSDGSEDGSGTSDDAVGARRARRRRRRSRRRRARRRVAPARRRGRGRHARRPAAHAERVV